MHTTIFNKLKTLFSQHPLKGTSLFVAASLIGFISLSSCDLQPSGSHPLTNWPLVQDCSLHHQACESQQAQQSVRLEILPRPIKVARMLDVSVQLKGIQAQKVELDIAGENMYMGYNRVQLSADPNQPGHYRGQSMLAFCTLDDMKWHISVLMTQPNGQVLAVPFALNTPQQR